MSNYTQQCRTCSVNIEGTGEDICYRCLQRERDALKGENQRLKDESSRFERVAFTYETDMDKLQERVSELEAAIQRYMTFWIESAECGDCQEEEMLCSRKHHDEQAEIASAFEAMLPAKPASP